MRRFAVGLGLTLICLTTVSIPVAHGQDKAKGELSYSADYRLRNTYLENESGAGRVSPAHSNRLDQRARLNLNFRASERLGATTTLLNSMQFGQTATDVVAEPRDAVTVNQAFGSWMISDDFIFKFGRMNYQIGDGFTIGTNEWEGVPYAFDGALFNYEFEFGRIQLFGFKMREYGPPAVAGGTTPVHAPDLEHNAYGFTFDLKTLPEVIKAVGLHIVKDAADRGVEDPAAGSQVQTVKGTQGMDVVRYGTNLAVQYRRADLKLWYAGVGGKNKYPPNTALAYHGSYEIESSMMQGELGVNVPSWRSSRFFVQYHVDSGDRTTDDKRHETYDSYFHVKHGSTGLMDLFDWGNLTSLQLGVTVKPGDQLDVGLSYWVLSRTQTGPDTARPLAGLYGGNLVPVKGTDDLDLRRGSLGHEVDLWTEYRHSNGLIMTARAGYFRPGDVFDTRSAGGLKRTDGILQLMFEGRVGF